MKVRVVRLRHTHHRGVSGHGESDSSAKPVILVISVSIGEGGAKIELNVPDGLPADFGERWYEPYTTSKAKGTGLGLAVVKKIAEEHAGSVRAENRPNGGAVFTLRLPLG